MNAADSLQQQRILRLPDVKTRTGLARSTIYLRVSEGTFPKPIALGPRSVGWIESEIDAWIAKRIAIARGHTSNPLEAR